MNELSKLKLVLAAAVAALLTTVILGQNAVPRMANAAIKAVSPDDAARDYLKANGYPEAVIELMDEEWRVRSHSLEARFIGSELFCNSEWSSITDFTTMNLRGQPFQEIMFAEQWNRARTEQADPIMRIHYFWIWQHQPFWTFNDWICITSADPLMNLVAEYWPANQTQQGPKERLRSIATPNGFQLEVKLNKSWRDDSGVKQRADHHLGHISFNCLPRTADNPQITLHSIYHNQRLPSLFKPRLLDGDTFAQWWAPSFFTNSGWSLWKLSFWD